MNSLYYVPEKPFAFASVQKVQKAVMNNNVKKKPSDIKEWLLRKDAYTLQRPLRNYFPRDPYTVNSFMDLWELDLIHLTSSHKYNHNYGYLLRVIDVF